MVQFTRLRLAGFKSFVDQAELLIEPGVTGVVGPNGCGKSNLVEALRWAMGETSARQMRGGEMDDVIFGGTTNRPARNIAEVVLHLDNNRHTAPAAFNEHEELEVTRRIERGGGSTYRVNGREVRARDVQLLFADAATGARSTAMVSQGRVGALINAKATDRRGLLEEAAGVTGLQSRRHETELRLKAAEANLERLDDITTTLDTQLAGLRKQAKQAARYRNLSEHIRKAEATLLHLRWKAVTAEQDEANGRLRQAEGAVALATRAAANAATAEAEAALTLPDLRHAEAEAAAALQRLKLAAEGIDAEEKRQDAARREAEGRLNQLVRDGDREKLLAADATAALQRLEEERQSLDGARAGEAEGRAAATAECEALSAEIAGRESDLTALTERVAADEARRAAAGRRLAELGEQRQRLAKRAADAADQEKAAARDGVDPMALEQAEATLMLAGERLEQARAEIEAADVARAACRSQENSAIEALRVVREAMARIKAEEGALARLLASGSGGFAPMVDALVVPPGFETALGAALGEDLEAPLDATAPVSWRDLGPLAEEQALPEGAACLAAIVTGPEALARRLSQTGLVADAETGAALQPLLRPGQRLVAKAGGLWRWDGLTIIAGAPTAAAIRLEQRNHLAQLRADLAAAAPGVEEAAARLDETKDAAAAAALRETEARDAVRYQERASQAARDAHDALTRKAHSAAARLDALAESRARLEADLAEAQAQETEARETLAALPETGPAREQVAGLRADLAERRLALAEARAALDRLVREAAGRARRLEAIAVEVQAWQARAEGAADQIETLVERRLKVEAEIQALSEAPARLAAQRGTLLTSIGTAEAARAQAADHLAVAESGASEAGKALRAAEAALAAAREVRVRCEAAIEQATQTRRDLLDRIAQRLQITPVELAATAGLTPDAAPPDPGEVERRLDRLQRERDSMGPVNLRAEQEAVELDQQITTMRGERDDLIAAIAKLRSGINGLNREARERLVASFKIVDGHFQELFVRLFGGGRAHLALTETDDPLQAGLEIMASPPGKKMQVLSLLSGGEQALTALALLFAVFLTNPAPICVLDEVDAPLDDANVERFCTLVDSLARNVETRFLVITHHRMTMARVDRLFGVTMAERGVSQLVSVDLHQAALLRKTA